MSEVETTMQHPIVSYLEIINIVDNERRALALAEIVAADVTYSHTHAPNAIHGRDELANLLQWFAKNRATTEWQPIGLPDTHHQAFRQRYRTLNGTTVVTQGTYCGQTNHEGKLHLLLGFIDVESA